MSKIVSICRNIAIFLIVFYEFAANWRTINAEWDEEDAADAETDWYYE